MELQISGGDALTAYLQSLASKVTHAAEVQVGWCEDATYPDGTSVAMVAAFDEFGHGTTPPRPFFRNMVAANADKWGPMVGALLNANHGDAARSLGQMGEEIKGELRDSITGGSYAPNSPVTNLLKERFPTGDYTAADVWQAFRDVKAGKGDAPAGKPLVWSGVMLQAIASRVT